jgi:hypothetical protein
MPSGRAAGLVAALLPVVIFLAVYIPRVGHGFILDDYRWVLESRVSEPSDLPRLFVQNNGFYRPIVSLTFALDFLLFGIQPFWYGLTNVVLAVGCAGLIYTLSRTLRLPWGAAALAASLWLLNFHGINMAVLWISGRTALLLTLAAVGAAILIVRQRLLLAAVGTAIALLSKEEAVALPVILGIWIYVLNRSEPVRWTRLMQIWTVSSVVILVAYFALRAYSGAMTPSTAPTYYQFTFEPVALVRNVLEYTDRTFTLPVVVVGLAWLILRWRRASLASHASIRSDVIACAVVWTFGAYALTIFLPIRSSLYSCLPLVGSCLIAATLCTAFWYLATEEARGLALRVAIVLILITAPIHYARTRRLVDQAETAQKLWKALPTLTQDLPEGATVAIHDDMTRRANVRAAFGSLGPPAYQLLAGRQLNFWFEPPLDVAAQPPCTTCIARWLVFKNDELSVGQAGAR